MVAYAGVWKMLTPGFPPFSPVTAPHNGEISRRGTNILWLAAA